MIKDLLKHPAFKDATEAYSTLIENQERIEKKLSEISEFLKKSGVDIQDDNSEACDDGTWYVCDDDASDTLREELYDLQMRVSFIESDLSRSSKSFMSSFFSALRKNQMLIVSLALAAATATGITALFLLNS